MALLRRLAGLLTADRVAALLFLAVFAAYGIGGSRIRAALDSDIVGPGFFPAIIAVLGVVLALVMLFKRRADDGGPAVEPDPVALVPVGLLLAYALILEYAGFALSTVVFLTAGFKYLGCRGWLRAGIYAIVSTVALVALFRYGLDLWLPQGRLVKVF